MAVAFASITSIRWRHVALLFFEEQVVVKPSQNGRGYVFCEAKPGRRKIVRDVNYTSLLFLR